MVSLRFKFNSSHFWNFAKVLFALELAASSGHLKLKANGIISSMDAKVAKNNEKF